VNKPRVSLVIDDSAPVRSLVANSLRAAGYRVLEAASSDEALAIVAFENVSLAVSDLYLDDRMSGLALLDQAVRLRPGLKGILMSGSLVPRQKLHTHFAILSKPFAPKTLVDLAERLLSEKD
jgi:DNA-binding NtrC family response regulator